VFDFLMGYVIGERNARQAASLARTSSGPGHTVVGDIHDVNERIDRMLLVVDAMWSFLQDQGFTDEHLRARIAALDASDGTTDGRRTSMPVQCPSCHAMVQAGRTVCAFCGETVESSPVDAI
jgi:hypothetical protein